MSTDIFCNVLVHSAIAIGGPIKLYFDPFMLQHERNDADIVFITHEHYDHFSPESIAKACKADTYYVLPRSMQGNQKINELSILDLSHLVFVEPKKSYEVKGIKFTTTPSYNLNAPYHQKAFKWVGYIVEANNLKYYIAGDTDNLDELHNIDCDVALVPVGGTYTMNCISAAKLVNTIKPHYAMPTHYGAIGGTADSATDFVNNVDSSIEVIL